MSSRDGCPAEELEEEELELEDGLELEDCLACLKETDRFKGVRPRDTEREEELDEELEEELL